MPRFYTSSENGGLRTISLPLVCRSYSSDELHVTNAFVYNLVEDYTSIVECVDGFPFSMPISKQIYANVNSFNLNNIPIDYLEEYAYTPPDDEYKLYRDFTLNNYDDTGDEFRFTVDFTPAKLGSFFANLKVRYTILGFESEYTVSFSGIMSTDIIEIDKVEFPDGVAGVEGLDPFTIIDISHRW